MLVDSILVNEYRTLMENEWKFIHRNWPVVKREKYHRTELKDVNSIGHIKEVVLNKLGPIPVFFFLTVLFPKHHPGPYRNVEKGLLLLYHLLKGLSFGNMDRYMPTSSLHEVHKSFYGYEKKINSRLDRKVTSKLFNMFSNLRIRMLSARGINPEDYKEVTLILDGHDTNGKEIGDESANYYSYKLKKPGFRTQACSDIRGMIIMTSESVPCKDNPDGLMFTEMDLENIIEVGDCMGLDGGYTLFIKQVLKNTKLEDCNFICPICKPRGVELTRDETAYNESYSSFRSSIENKFADIGKVFEMFNNKRSYQTSYIKFFNLQLRVACLLLNIKRFVELGNIRPNDTHKLWLNPGFDYPSGETPDPEPCRIQTLREKREQSKKIYNRQEALLANKDENMPHKDGSNTDMSDKEGIFEIEKIVNHRWKGKTREYLVKWKGSVRATLMTKPQPKRQARR